MAKTKKSKKKQKREKVKKEETEEDVLEVEQNKLHLEVKPNSPISLPDNVSKHLDDVIDTQITRLLLIKNSFAEIKEVLVNDEHFFLHIIEDFIPFYIQKEKLDINSPPAPQLREYTRQRILKKASERFQLNSSVLNTLQGDYVSQQLYNFLKSQQTIQLPPLSLQASTFAKNSALRTPTMKYLIENTYSTNRNEMDTIKPELADNLTDKRKDIFKKLHPLEKDNQILSTLLSTWDTVGDIPIEVEFSNAVVKLRETQVERENVTNESDSFSALLGCNSLDTLSSRLVKLQSWEGVRSEDLPEVCDSVLAPIQDLIRRFRLFSSALEEFLFSENELEPKLIPACSLAVRLFSKHQMQILFDINKSEIERISKEESPTKEQDIEAIEKDQKFIKQVLGHWEKKTKICKRNCVWYLSLRSRTIPKAQVSEDEIALLRCKLADLYLYIYEKEEEFQTIIKTEAIKLRQVIQLGLSLNVWSSLHERKQLDILSSYSDKLTEIPVDQFPSLSHSRRFLKNLEKMNTISKKIGDLETKETQIPALEIRSTKVNKNFVDNLLSTYEEELESLKESKKKKSKEKAIQIEQEIEQLQKLSNEMKKSKKNSKQLTLKTLPRTTSIKNLSKEEKRALGSQSKVKSSSQLKKCESLKQKAKTIEKPLREVYEELLESFREKIQILRNLEQNQNFPPPHLILYVSSLPYLSLDLISSPKIIPENIIHVVEMWKNLSPFLAASDVQEFIDKQFDGFPSERVQLEAEFAVGEKSMSAVDNEETEVAHLSDNSKKMKGNKALSVLECDGLLLLTRGLEYLDGTSGTKQSSAFLSAHEQTLLLDLLQHMQGNSQLNTRIAEILEQESIPFGISSEALKFCRTFTFKSRHLESLHPFTTKLESAWARASGGENVPKREKITLKELGILRTMERWGSDLVRILRLFKEDNNEQSMYKVLVDAVAAHKNLRRIYDEIQEQINADDTYQSGDLLLTVWTRKVKTMQGNKPPAAFSFLMSFTKYEHTAVIYRNINPEVGPIGEPRLSHMYRQYHDSELTLEDLASSDIFRMSAPALLQENFGEEWEKVIQDRYCVIESTLHSGKQATLGNITNPMSRVMNIGTAAVLPWTRLRRTNMDFEKIRSTLYEEDNKSDLQMTCSEFAAKSQIAALLELDEQLMNELSLPESEEGKNIFTLPFHAKEKFKTMQPDRLRHLLADNNALSKVPFPSFIDKLVYL